MISRTCTKCLHGAIILGTSQYHPSNPDDLDRLHQFGAKVLSGVFVGYKQHSGGGWTGDWLILDWEEIEEAELSSQIYTKTIKHKECIVVYDKEGNFCFPAAEGRLRQSEFDEYRAVRPGHKRKASVAPDEEEQVEEPPQQVVEEPVEEEGDGISN